MIDGNVCQNCKFWTECGENHGSNIMGFCSVWRSMHGKEITEASDVCENWTNEDCCFEESFYAGNLPNFPLNEGDTYFVPLKLLSKERRNDCGRETEYFTFGVDNWRKITFADYNFPNIKELDKND